MAKIITVPNDDDTVMNAERERLAIWAPINFWVFSAYNDEADHLAQIAAAGNGAMLEILDFDCHGTPITFDHTNLQSVMQFGKNLSQITGFSANTCVYLDACNTGLTTSAGDGPVAQVLANAAGCTVYGTKGYMTGTYAEGTEHCYASYQGLAPYPNAQDAIGRNVWIPFLPRPGQKKPMKYQSSFTLRAGSRDQAELIGMLERIMRTPPVDFPKLRMAPDTTINYINNDGIVVLDVYANGSLLKNRISGTAWHVEFADPFRILVQHLRSD